MNNKKYQWILYLIVFVILSTIGIQIYWNYKNYQTNKQQLINDVQVSLDNAVNDYYANLAEQNTIALAVDDMHNDSLQGHFQQFDSIVNRFRVLNRNDSELDSFEINIRDGRKTIPGHFTDSIYQIDTLALDSIRGFNRLIFKDLSLSNADSVSVRNFRTLTSQVIISLSQDTVDLKAIDSLFKIELDRKQISVDYNLKYQTTIHFRKIPSDSIDFFDLKKDFRMNSNSLSAIAKSSFLPPNDILKIEFSNANMSILKRILLGILISTLLVLAVISCLFYLLKIIKHQKQLAEVKNDLISNITHEFKTPIATIGVALESIKDFNAIDDAEKTKSYLEMSGLQLKKLNVMVEKLLETATLDSDNLFLNKESYDLVELLKNLTDKHNMGLEGKTISFDASQETVLANIDIFHFENAIDNIIDNAIKYGGDHITISLNQKDKDLIAISISDNGRSLTKSNKDKIFEKFYRIPKGNTHDVKGFGIGLYYSRSIIEKHNGLIVLELKKDVTTFKISIPK